MNQNIGFNPRAQQNSNALSEFVVADLITSCPAIRTAIQSEALTPKKNSEVNTASAVRTVDLVLFEKLKLPLISVCISVENKTIMTAHGKARKNRYGDIIAYSNHMHNHRRECIAGAIVVVNVSPKYENPDEFAKGLVRPKFDMEKIVKDTINIFARIPLRNDPGDPRPAGGPGGNCGGLRRGVGSKTRKGITGSAAWRQHPLREFCWKDWKSVRAAIQRTMIEGRS